MLDAYQSHVAERATQGIPALPLTKTVSKVLQYSLLF